MKQPFNVTHITESLEFLTNGVVMQTPALVIIQGGASSFCVGWLVASPSNSIVRRNLLGKINLGGGIAARKNQPWKGYCW